MHFNAASCLRYFPIKPLHRGKAANALLEEVKPFVLFVFLFFLGIIPGVEQEHGLDGYTISV